MAKKSVIPKDIQDALAGAKAAEKAAKVTTKAKARTETSAAAAEESEAQKVANAKASRESFRERLGSGNLNIPASSLDTIGFSEHPNAISTNTSYHDALHASISDLRKRYFDIENNEVTATEKKLQKDVDAMNTTLQPGQKAFGLDDLRDAKGRRRIAVVSTATSKKLDAPRYHLEKADQYLKLAHSAHKTGDALSAVDYFSKAADHVHASIKTANEKFSLNSQKYKSVLNPIVNTAASAEKLEAHSEEGNEMGLGRDWLNNLSDTVNGYVNHVGDASIRSGKLHPEVFSQVSKELNRNYGKRFVAAGENVAPSADIPNWAKTKTRQETIDERKATQGRQRLATAKEKALAGGMTIVKPHDAPVSLENVSYGPHDEEAYGRFQQRWRRDEVLPKFEADERRNVESAANSGEKYTPKTFVGSAAWENPDEWHDKLQVKNHWLKTKGNQAHKFEGWWKDNADPTGAAGYANAKDYGKKHGLEMDGVPFPMKKWGKRTGLSGFAPTRGESANAKENNEEDVPEDVNRRQVSRARTAGVRINKSELLGILKGATIDHPTKKDSQGNPLKVKFEELSTREQNKYASTTATTRFGSTKSDFDVEPEEERTDYREQSVPGPNTAFDQMVTDTMQPKNSRNSAFNSGRGV